MTLYLSVMLVYSIITYAKILFLGEMLVITGWKSWGLRDSEVLLTVL